MGLLCYLHHPDSHLLLLLLPLHPQVGKETGGKKLEAPHALKANEMAQVTFAPVQPLVVDSFKSCEGLSRIAFLDGNTAVMLGKVVTVTQK
jgi:elongation factor 1-alpha